METETNEQEIEKVRGETRLHSNKKMGEGCAGDGETHQHGIKVSRREIEGCTVDAETHQQDKTVSGTQPKLVKISNPT